MEIFATNSIWALKNQHPQRDSISILSDIYNKVGARASSLWRQAMMLLLIFISKLYKWMSWYFFTSKFYSDEFKLVFHHQKCFKTFSMYTSCLNSWGSMSEIQNCWSTWFEIGPLAACLHFTLTWFSPGLRGVKNALSLITGIGSNRVQTGRPLKTERTAHRGR